MWRPGACARSFCRSHSVKYWIGYGIAALRSMTLSEGTWTRRLAPHASAIPTTVAEVMTRAPHTIGRDATLSHASDLMSTHDLGLLPVVDGDQIVGLLYQRDLCVVEALGARDQRVDDVTAAMNARVYLVAPGDLVADVVRVMAEHEYGCAVVVDRRRVVGIFTVTDALGLPARTVSKTVERCTELRAGTAV